MVRQVTKDFQNIESVKGTLELPGDKSISHRSVMFAALAKGKSIISNCLNASDIQSTINCFVKLGCRITRNGNVVTVEGRGYKGFTAPESELDAGNSGTTARLLSGILAAQDFKSTIIGDESLSGRPMKRIIQPLSLMGADIRAEAGNFLPIHFKPSNKLIPIEFFLPVASAQLKSAVLLAGLHLEGITTVIEHETSRNHTENMLGLSVVEESGIRKISVSKNNYPSPFELFVPSDISSASFFIVLGLLLKNSELIIKDVLLNETRSGVLKVLKMMGAHIDYENVKVNQGESFGNLIIRSSQLKNVHIPKELIPNIIDEIPVLSIAGLIAEGSFEVRNAKELRVKESDRIKSVCSNMQILGLDVEEFEDGFKINGEISNSRHVFNSFGDHRIAMAFSILSMLLPQGGSVLNFECVGISNPKFLDQIKSIAG